MTAFPVKSDPDYDLVRSRAYGHAVARGWITPTQQEEAMKWGVAELGHDRQRGFVAEREAENDDLLHVDPVEREVA